MAIPRSAAGILFAGLPPIDRVPEVISSSPAIRRSRVDLPHPEGPTKTTSSRSAIDSDTFRTASTLPKLLLIFLSSTDATDYPLVFPALQWRDFHDKLAHWTIPLQSR